MDFTALFLGLTQLVEAIRIMANWLSIHIAVFVTKRNSVEEVSKMDIIDRLINQAVLLNRHDDFNESSSVMDILDAKKEIESLRAQLKTKEPMRAVTKIVMEENDYFREVNAQLQSQIDEIYALPAVAYEIETEILGALEPNLVYACLKNWTDYSDGEKAVPLVSLPPRGEV